MEPISVTTLNNQIKSLLQSHYQSIYVKGEVSRVTYHSSGHIYFTLKDENSAINCVMFKSYNKDIKFRIEDGMDVVCFGSISVYTPRGSYQLNIVSIEPQGSGTLSVAFEQLKKKLQALGYFDEDKKKPIPKFPRKIVLVTSKSGAALQDMLKIAKKRFPLVKFILVDTLVQGEDSAKDIVNSLKIADSLQADLIILARGGGSLEDLWSFNEEIVAKAIYEAKTPIISAVGHEIDFLISDFVADKRASTPSNAIEIALPDINEILFSLDLMLDEFGAVFLNLLSKKEKELSHLKELFTHLTLNQKIKNESSMLLNLQQNLDQNLELILNSKLSTLNFLKESLKSLDPNIYKKGLAFVSKDDKAANLESLKKGDIIFIQNSNVKIKAKVLELFKKNNI